MAGIFGADAAIGLEVGSSQQCDISQLRKCADDGCGMATTCNEYWYCGACSIGEVCVNSKCVKQTVPVLSKCGTSSIDPDPLFNELCGREYGTVSCTPVSQSTLTPRSDPTTCTCDCSRVDQGLTGVSGYNGPQVIPNCIQNTCAGLGYACGRWIDVCGNTLKCGSCATGQTCSAGKCVSQTVDNTCTSKTCATLGNYACGSWSDGCGKTLNCGTCATGKTCSNGACVSQTEDCAANDSKKCYNGDVFWYDSCGERGTLYSACSSDQSCSGGACVSNSSPDSSSSCVTKDSKRCYDDNVYWYDFCGERGTLYATCASSETCSNGACVSQAANTFCAANDSKKCYNGDVFWYDSCGERGDLYDACNNGRTCSAGACQAAATAAPTVGTTGLTLEQVQQLIDQIIAKIAELSAQLEEMKK